MPTVLPLTMADIKKVEFLMPRAACFFQVLAILLIFLNYYNHRRRFDSHTLFP